jgi:hypothetical protein
MVEYFEFVCRYEHGKYPFVFLVDIITDIVFFFKKNSLSLIVESCNYVYLRLGGLIFYSFIFFFE